MKKTLAGASIIVLISGVIATVHSGGASKHSQKALACGAKRVVIAKIKNSSVTYVRKVTQPEKRNIERMLAEGVFDAEIARLVDIPCTE